MKRYFSITEWLKSARTDDIDILRKIEWWADTLTPVREKLGEPVIITHGLRSGTGTSQHYFKMMGATDLRPALSADNYWESFERLGKLLEDVQQIKRICVYPPGALFPNGGYHIDAKTIDRQLFVSDADEVNWKFLGKYDYFDTIANSNSTGRTIGI